MDTAIVEGYQLSPQQKRLWLLKQNFQDMPGRVRCTVLLKGNVDIPGMRAAFQNVIDRHEILRTLFPTITGMDVPLQVIGDVTTVWQDGLTIPIQQEQCSQLDFEAILPDIVQQIADQDLNSPAIARLYTLGKAIHVLFLDMPGLWLDHQGIRCMVNDLIRCYQHGASSEREEPVQYAAVAQWLNELLLAPEGGEGRAYWREKSIAERPLVPFSRNVGASKHFYPQRLRTIIAPTIIAPTVIEKIEKLTATSEGTLQSFLLAALHVLIWRMTARGDIVIGSTLDGRTETELCTMPGLLTRSLPILAHIESEHSFASVWKEVTEAIQEAEGWQDCFDWSIIPHTNGEDRTTDYFPICFEFHNREQEYGTGDITGTIIDSLVYSDLFDLRLVCTRIKRGLAADFYFNREALSYTDTVRLAAYFTKLVEEVVANREASIGSLEFLGEAERHTLLNDLAHGKHGVLVQSCLPYAFEEQVKRTPDNIALICQDREYTYAELNVQANKLAHQLKRSGVKSETMVAYCTERSVETIVSLLGILKAGGVCVPLDPAYPKERLAFILQDSQSTIVVTQEKLAYMFSEHDLEIVNIETVIAFESFRSSTRSPVMG